MQRVRIADSLPIQKECASDEYSLLDRNILSDEPIMIFAQRLHSGIRHGVGCRQQHGVCGMHVPAGDAVCLVDEGSPSPERLANTISPILGWALIRSASPAALVAVSAVVHRG
jgi:hypothetical protein